jgi:hypothetical protein
MHQRKVVSDNEWIGWLRMMRSCFEQGKIREYWEGGLELEKWFDPAFEEFINNESYLLVFQYNFCHFVNLFI